MVLLGNAYVAIHQCNLRKSFLISGFWRKRVEFGPFLILTASCCLQIVDGVADNAGRVSCYYLYRATPPAT